jgi:hypothetical protein
VNGDDTLFGADEGKPQVAPSVVSAIVNAYYPRVVASADAARARAQSAYAIASAVAGALVIALITSKSQTASTAAKVLGVAALALWLCAAVLYIRAIAVPLLNEDLTDAVRDPGEFAGKVLANAHQQRTEVDKRQRCANWAGIAAMVLTAAASAVLFLDPSATNSESPGMVVLTRPGLHAIQQVCPAATRVLTGLVDRTTLNSQFISLTLTGDTCAGTHGSLRISQEQVLVVRLDGG